MSQDEKPREWFLYESVIDDADTLTAVPRGDDPLDQYANMITVIEKSAYDALKAENERLKAHADAMAEALDSSNKTILYLMDYAPNGLRLGRHSVDFNKMLLTAYRKDFPK